MSVVRFIFDKKKDIENIYDTCKMPSKWGKDFSKSLDPKIMDLAKNKSLNKTKTTN